MKLPGVDLRGAGEHNQHLSLAGHLRLVGP
jgi:hypothetical protein